jgi:hypothetical protein
LKRSFLFSACLVVMCGAGPALAHAFLDRASPPTLNLTYTEPVEPLFSTVKVTWRSRGRGKINAAGGRPRLVRQTQDPGAWRLQCGVACHLG